jgi:hypothetical protein
MFKFRIMYRSLANLKKETAFLNIGFLDETYETKRTSFAGNPIRAFCYTSKSPYEVYSLFVK